MTSNGTNSVFTYWGDHGAGKNRTTIKHAVTKYKIHEQNDRAAEKKNIGGLNLFYCRQNFTLGSDIILNTHNCSASIAVL